MTTLTNAELTKLNQLTSISVERLDTAGNQIILRDTANNLQVFFSYNTKIAAKINNKVIIYPAYDYSRTTGKYRNMFLNEVKADTEKKLKLGTYLYIEKGK